jgi:hypothetical protein
VRKAKALDEAGTPFPASRKAKPRGEPEVPEDLSAALEQERNWKHEKGSGRSAELG